MSSPRSSSSGPTKSYILAQPISPPSILTQRLNPFRTPRRLVLQIQSTNFPVSSSSDAPPRSRSIPLYNLYEVYSGGLLAQKATTRSAITLQLRQFEDPGERVAEIRSGGVRRLDPDLMGEVAGCVVTFRDETRKWEGMLECATEAGEGRMYRWCLRLQIVKGMEVCWRGRRKNGKDRRVWMFSVALSNTCMVVCAEKKEREVLVMEKKIMKVMREQRRGRDGGDKSVNGDGNGHVNSEDMLNPERLRELIFLTGAYLEYMESLMPYDS